MDYVHSLPAGNSNALLAPFLDSDFNLLALDRLGEGNAAECGVSRSRLSDAEQYSARSASASSIIRRFERRAERPRSSRLQGEIREAGEDADVHLLDHLIIAGGIMFDISL